MSTSHEGKVVVVTGAGNGIGKAIALRFAQAGARVAVNDVDALRAEEVTKEILDEGGSAMTVVADVSSGDEVREMFEKVLKNYESVDVLVNNAGLISPMLHFFEADESWWRRIIDVNLTGHFLCSQQAARIMAKKGNGVIINMSSGGATRAHRAFCAYDASKGGIEALTRAMALDLGPYGIRVCALMPGSIDTEGMDEDARRLRGENIPLGYPGDPNDMAGPALFLASEDASYITGDVIKVDGGMLSQQRSATVDIMPPQNFPPLENL
ncbi:MAG TPA: SDR family NAD(P)-dependent oxidoreductase [Acidimicrobiales bacterium]|nr:SDR family NAD(P)-dependent oxidoreductase [Acidimicrobiales bacterium]|tara:strand:+ start:1635 stop:2438 length:804 start_codon:yes stop_codon:yes gene_type:complete